jgi:hypothetical protein
MCIALAGSFGAGCGGNGSDASHDSGAVVQGPDQTMQSPITGVMNNPPMNPPVSTVPMGAAGMGAPVTGTGGSGMPMTGTGGSGMPMTGTGGAGMPMTGTGGSGGTMMNPMTPVTDCGMPPDGASDNAVQAWMLLNETRLAAGSGCMNLVLELATSAQKHCDYGVTNRGNASCTADAHTEIDGCPGFTGKDVQSREIAAGYPRMLAYTEVATTFGNNPVAALPNWIDTVYHRIPLLDPWTADMGYGGADNCDVIDIGRGTSTAPQDLIVTYPYDGQTNVPPAWNGLEGPAPPAPAGGWPSSYVINVYAQGIQVSEHVLTKDGDDTPLDHVFLDINSPEISGLQPYFHNTVFIYGAPFELNTKYRVKVVGTRTGGDLNVEWTFTTGSMRPFGT